MHQLHDKVKPLSFLWSKATKKKKENLAFDFHFLLA